MRKVYYRNNTVQEGDVHLEMFTYRLHRIESLNRIGQDWSHDEPCNLIVNFRAFIWSTGEATGCKERVHSLHSSHDQVQVVWPHVVQRICLQGGASVHFAHASD